MLVKSQLSAIAILVVVASSCASPVPSAAPSPSLPIATPASTRSPAPSAATTPTPSVLLPFDDLPEGSLEHEGATLICDADPDQLDINAGQTLAPCYDGLLMGLRALLTAGGNLFDRLYLQ